MRIKHIPLLFFLIGVLALTAFSLLMNIGNVGVAASGEDSIDSPASVSVDFVPGFTDPLIIRYCRVSVSWRVSSGDFTLRVEVYHIDGVSVGEVSANPSTSTYLVALNSPYPDVRKITGVKVYLVRRS